MRQPYLVPLLACGGDRLGKGGRHTSTSRGGPRGRRPRKFDSSSCLTAVSVVRNAGRCFCSETFLVLISEVWSTAAKRSSAECTKHTNRQVTSHSWSRAHAVVWTPSSAGSCRGPWSPAGAVPRQSVACEDRGFAWLIQFFGAVSSMQLVAQDVSPHRGNLRVVLCAWERQNAAGAAFSLLSHSSQVREQKAPSSRNGHANSPSARFSACGFP